MNFPHFDLENELSEALAVIHKKLEPVEKGIYLLREVFDFDYEELQKIFGKKKENCRQLFARAKEKLTQDPKPAKGQKDQYFQFLENFKKACSVGNFTDLIAQLTQEEGNKTKIVKIFYCFLSHFPFSLVL